MIDPTIVVGSISLLGLVASPLIAYLLSRKKDTSAEGRLNHDELQEDLAALRKEFRDFRIETNATMAYQGSVITHLDNEVIAIRQGVEAGNVPPLPPRPPWPSRIASAA